MRRTLEHVPILWNRISHPPFVPAKAGTQGNKRGLRARGNWVPAFAGTNGGCGSVRTVHALVFSVLAAFVVGVLALSSAITPVRAQSDYYRNKTIAIVIGAKSGSLTIAAQIVSRHLGQYIPGNPTVIVRQMPGGAHLVASGYVYNVA